MKTSITMAVSSALIGLSSAQCKYGQVVSEDDINTNVPLDVCIAKLDGSNKAHVQSCDDNGYLLKQSFTTYTCDEGTNDGDAASSDELVDIQCTEDDVCDYYHVYEFAGVADTACGSLETADLNEQGQGGISSRFFMSGISGGELNVCQEYPDYSGFYQGHSLFEQGVVTSGYCDAEIAVTGYVAATVRLYTDDQCSIADASITAGALFVLTDENTILLTHHNNKCRFFAGCSPALTANTASHVGEYDEDDAASYAADDVEDYAEGGDSGSYAGDDTESDADVTIDGHSTGGDNYGGDDDGSDDGDDTGNCAVTIIVGCLNIVIIIAILYYCLKQAIIYQIYCNPSPIE